MPPKPIRFTAFAASLAFVAHGALAHEEERIELEPITVEGRADNLAGEARSASEGVIGQAELEHRPLLRPGDIMEAIPGLIMTQHSGSGKSNQMFLRGFNLDHGTDFATYVDGMPVNMRSHGHGQGYTDVNFLIPELVRTIEFVKGPYHAEQGDFSSAGGARITTFDRLPGQTLRVAGGENGYLRGLLAGSAGGEASGWLGAVEVQRYDGPWTDIEEDLDKLNGLLRWSGRDAGRDWAVTAMFYDADWNSADQVPQRAVEQGLIGPFGSLDTDLGGESSRYSLSGRLGWSDRAGAEHVASAYVIDYRMRLFSNFTYFLDDPVNGDEFEQFDDRRIWGGEWERRWAGGADAEHRLGVQARYDDVAEVGLYRTVERRRVDTTRRDALEEWSVGAFYEFEWRFAERWRSVLGLRADAYGFDVSSNIPENSGTERDEIVSPKASLIYAASERTEFYLSAGSGFHSNDARGTTIRFDPVSGEPVQVVDPLVRSVGAEVGFKTAWLDGWNTSLALWTLELDSELLYVGDAGNTEASRPSRRWGVELNNFWRLDEVWTAEADLAWTDARFDDTAPEGDRIPGALETVFTGAVTAELPSGWFGQLRWRWFSAFPLIEDDSVRADGSSMVNLALGWERDGWRVQLDALNLFDSDDHDVDYFYASRLPGEPQDGVEDIHTHIFEPRQFRLSLGRSF